MGTDGCVEMKPEDRYAVPAMSPMEAASGRRAQLSVRVAHRFPHWGLAVVYPLNRSERTVFG